MIYKDGDDFGIKNKKEFNQVIEYLKRSGATYSNFEYESTFQRLVLRDYNENGNLMIKYSEQGYNNSKYFMENILKEARKIIYEP